MSNLARETLKTLKMKRNEWVQDDFVVMDKDVKIVRNEKGKIIRSKSKANFCVMGAVGFTLGCLYDNLNLDFEALGRNEGPEDIFTLLAGSQNLVHLDSDQRREVMQMVKTMAIVIRQEFPDIANKIKTSVYSETPYDQDVDLITQFNDHRFVTEEDVRVVLEETAKIIEAKQKVSA